MLALELVLADVCACCAHVAIDSSVVQTVQKWRQIGGGANMLWTILLLQ